MKLDLSRLDGVRARAHATLTKLPGKAGALARKANDALGRPLADAGELADRRAFETRGAVQTQVTASSVPSRREAAPVVLLRTSVEHATSTPASKKTASDDEEDARNLGVISEANRLVHQRDARP